MVHPDEVVLLDGNVTDAANVLRGEVAGLRDEQHHTAVLVRIAGLPEPLTVYVGRQPARALQLGRPVTIDLRHALHVLHD